MKELKENQVKSERKLGRMKQDYSKHNPLC